MAIVSSSELADTLRPFLTPAQLGEVRHALQPGLDSAQGLAQELVRRGWLTLYQARLLLSGRGADLLLGPYVVLDRLGAGAAGQVYKAWHPSMQCVVALKVLRPEAARDPEVVQRFYREIEVVSQIAHPNIVYAHEAGPVGKVVVLTLEYVEGRTLEQQVEASDPLPAPRACAYIRQAALGLQYAHERGLVHRDIKPSNLLVTGDHQVKILDLGLARLCEATGSNTADLTVAGNRSVTQGTPDYMAPEQALDFHTADIRADIYSLGCTFFFLLAGHPPFSGGTLAQKLMKHQTAPPPLDGVRPALPPVVARILGTMLAKDPDERYQTPGEVAQALQVLGPSGGTALGKGSAPDTFHGTPDEHTVQETVAGFPGPAPLGPRPWFRHRRRLGLLLAVTALAAGVALLAALRSGTGDRSGPAPAPRAAVTTAAPLPGARPVRVGAYRERFQGPTAAPGWQYLWNAKGPFGNPAHYQALLWAGAEYNADGKGAVPRPEPGAYVRLARDGGHPGRGARQRYASILAPALSDHWSSARAHLCCSDAFSLTGCV